VNAAIDYASGAERRPRWLPATSLVALDLDGGLLPVSRALVAAYPDGRARARAAASGGEDYELLFTAPAGREAAIRRLSGRLGLELTRIGEVRRGRGVHLRGTGTARVHGFDHLA